MKIRMMFVAALFSITASAQDSISNQTKITGSDFTLAGFVDAYYAYDFNKPADNKRPSFLYNHTRHNEFNINLAYIKGSYTTERARATIAIGAGTYMNANYAAEPGVLKNLYEANAGIKLSKKKNLWIDVGVLPAHIGFESAQSSVCLTLTRSIIAENSPYFESGAKITYTTDNEKWIISALALNGWQRIQRVDGNSLISWGTQLQFKPSPKTTLNYSTFLGTDSPDSTRKYRYFHNLYGIFQFNDNWGLILGFDIGQEQQEKGSSSYNTWFGTSGILQFTPNPGWAFAVRGEYYDDEKGVIINTGTPNGFKTFGASLNIDRKIIPNVMWRVEFRTFQSKDKIFIKESNPKTDNTAITSSIAISF